MKILKNTVLITSLAIIVLLLSGCKHKHTFEITEGMYQSESLEQEWTEEFYIKFVNIELISISEELFDAANDKNVFYTRVTSKMYYEVSIILFDEENNELKLNVGEFKIIPQLNAYQFYFEKDGERHYFRLYLEVDGVSYDNSLDVGTLCNGLEIIIHSESIGYFFNFKLELQ